MPEMNRPGRKSNRIQPHNLPAEAGRMHEDVDHSRNMQGEEEAGQVRDMEHLGPHERHEADETEAPESGRPSEDLPGLEERHRKPLEDDE